MIKMDFDCEWWVVW